MQKHKLNKTTVFRFRRFCRAAYAAFNSLHRVVNIGRLASYIADRQLHKSAVATAFCLALLPVQSWAQADDTLDEHTLPVVDIIVQADTLFGSPEPAAVLTAEHFSNSSVRTLGDLIAMLPGVDLRSRGGNDVQGDLAMRGGSFDQTVLLLNGINLTDAQTGHHILDLPVDISMVQRVELLSPAQLMARGIASFDFASLLDRRGRRHLLPAALLWRRADRERRRHAGGRRGRGALRLGNRRPARAGRRGAARRAVEGGIAARKC